MEGMEEGEAEEEVKSKLGIRPGRAGSTRVDPAVYSRPGPKHRRGPEPAREGYLSAACERTAGATYSS